MRKFPLVIFILLLAQGCNPSAGIYMMWKNDNIDKGVREQLKEINDNFIRTIRDNDIAGGKALLSDVLLEQDNEEKLKNIFSTISERFSLDSYRVLDEYYIKNSNAEVINIIPSGDSGDNDYTVKYKALNKEIYISLLIPENPTNEPLIIAIYGKYDTGWKLNKFHVGIYNISHKTAIDYYKLARVSYNKSYLVDAANNMELAIQCTDFPDELFEYRKDKDMRDFQKTIMSEINEKYVFPLTIGKLDTQPQVFNIYPQQMEGDRYPMVQYLTKINLDDTVRLREENDRIKQVIGEYFFGIDKDKDYVIYRAYNEMPGAYKNVRTYGFVDRLRK